MNNCVQLHVGTDIRMSPRVHDWLIKQVTVPLPNWSSVLNLKVSRRYRKNSIFVRCALSGST